MIELNNLQTIIEDIESHDVEKIIKCFQNGVDPNDRFRNKPLVDELITNYARGPKFAECFRAFVDYGLEFEDKVLLAVFLNDPVSLDSQLSQNPAALHKKYTLDCAFTPLFEVSLLHICAEYNHLACAKVLVQYGAAVNVKAGTDENGFGGHTPIFHTVNQNENKCIDVLKYLVEQSAALGITVKGLIWGKGYQWETFVPAVNPISYAMMGLLPQFQRTEIRIYEVVNILLKAAYGTDYKPQNVPNKYLR